MATLTAGVIWSLDFHTDGIIYSAIRALIAGVGIAYLLYMRNRIITLKRDYLTGLYRRFVAEERIDTLSRSKKDVTVAIIDVNGLRHINNTLGHPTGDQLLIEVANRLSRLSRFGLVARLGGDEFIVVTDQLSAGALCADLRCHLNELHIFGDFTIAAAGVARARRGRVRDAMKCADNAQRRAKATGATALLYDCVLDGIPPVEDRPLKRLRDRD
jgi:diguanylate cyclase (GGDEF)-like protein